MGCGGLQALRRVRRRVRVCALALCAGWVFGALLLYGTRGPSELHRVFLLSRHVQTYPALLTPRPRPCSWPRPLALLLAVKSQASHGAQRAALRASWAGAGQGAGVCVVFLLGRGQEGQGALLEESRRHGDILQWDFRESFFNLTLKELLFWHWLSRESESAHNTIGPAHPSHGSAPFILRTDDDVFVDVGGVLTLLRLLPGPSHPLYMGRAFVDTYPVRLWWIKYYVPHSLYPSGPYPPYLGGGGYLVSRETVRLFLGVSGAVPLFPIDDVYVGMCARAANVSVQHHPAFLPLEFSPALPSCTYAGALVLHKLGPQQLSQLFRELSNQSHCTASAPGL
ncbi:N-acetyllactosaminide beta-1,3-N-acetylglucosaminyltransferase 4-like [Conger conger]|uniref:N-acetyllactosaminide beta-1,3-N-acetylglucosaminyltransferase 4-like n=1 Tax=Conger conger TaxID=82655 RepID=UPI002A59F9AA|nr:N-acetyllactosaminide beta-1,3-N-acetylglucosaminyltransferase 4-like [Conger conger]